MCRLPGASLRTAAALLVARERPRATKEQGYNVRQMTLPDALEISPDGESR